MFIQDGYITGVLSPHTKKCPVCGAKGRVIDVAGVSTPGFSPSATVMWNRAVESIHTGIGLTCGCYAKFHRQVAHIADSRMRSGHAL